MTMINGTKFTIGADPEVFVKKGAHFRSAHNMVPGTKDAPHVVDKGAIQVDGMALEYNIDPCETADQFVEYNNAVLAELGKRIPKGHKIVVVPTADFGAKHMAEQPPEALELGCDPDYNAYTGEANPRPNAQDITFRTGAGHIHIGWGEFDNPKSEEHMEVCRMIARQLDAYLGCASLSWDDDTKRRELYGCAGAFRPKSYGMEYRTMSNKWVGDEKLMRIVFDNTIKAMQALTEGKYVGNNAWARGDNPTLRQVINTSRKETARAVCDILGAKYVR